MIFWKKLQKSSKLRESPPPFRYLRDILHAKNEWYFLVLIVLWALLYSRSRVIHNIGTVPKPAALQRIVELSTSILQGKGVGVCEGRGEGEVGAQTK